MRFSAEPRTLVGLLVTLVAAGCAAPGFPPPPEIPEAPEGPLALSEPVLVLGTRARETDIVQSERGTLFVAGYSGGGQTPANAPLLWRSDDAGSTWSRVDVGTPRDGAVGNSDVDLAYRGGVLYLASMSFSMIGHSIAVGASEDDGATWRWRLLSAQPLSDRPWVAVAPDGAAHAVWNDGLGVHHARSEDRGGTWVETAPPHERGGSGQLAIAPDGTVAVRIIPASGSGYTRWEEADGVAVSRDGGDSWRFLGVPGERRYASFFGDGGGEPFRWADPLAFDEAGTLYTAWPQDDSVVLARSADAGETWDVSLLANASGGVPHFPALFARAPGELLATWYELGDDIVAHVAHVTRADTDAPLVRAAAFETTNAQGRTGGEYFGASFLREGSMGVTMTRHGPDASDADKGFEYRVAR